MSMANLRTCETRETETLEISSTLEIVFPNVHLSALSPDRALLLKNSSGDYGWPAPILP